MVFGFGRLLGAGAMLAFAMGAAQAETLDAI